MSKLVQLKAGDTVVYDQQRQAWFADDGEPLTANRNARATLAQGVNFYDTEGVRSHNFTFTITITEQYEPPADA